MVKKLNQKEYAEIMGVKQAAISYRLKKGMPLPGVKKIDRFSRFFVLHFDDKHNVKNNFKNNLK